MQSFVSITNGSPPVVSVLCPTGKHAVGGGYDIGQHVGLPTPTRSSPNSTGTGWFVAFESDIGTVFTANVTVYALCVATP